MMFQPVKVITFPLKMHSYSREVNGDINDNSAGTVDKVLFDDAIIQ